MLTRARLTPTSGASGQRRKNTVARREPFLSHVQKGRVPHAENRLNDWTLRNLVICGSARYNAGFHVVSEKIERYFVASDLEVRLQLGFRPIDGTVFESSRDDDAYTRLCSELS